MRVGLYAAPLSLDPHLENEFLTSAVLANAFEGLTSLDGGLRVAPALAVSWDTPGPSTWRFRLRPGARFQDGRPVTARDVAWSLERARRHPRSGVSHYLADVVEVRVAAPDVVEIRTQASTSLLLNRLSFIAIVPEGSPAAIRSPIGTGPYRLGAEGFPDDLTLRRSDVYWGRRPPEPVVRLLVLKDPSRARAMLLSGDLDVSLGPAPAEAHRLRSEACCRVVAQPAVVVEASSAASTGRRSTTCGCGAPCTSRRSARARGSHARGVGGARLPAGEPRHGGVRARHPRPRARPARGATAAGPGGPSPRAPGHARVPGGPAGGRDRRQLGEAGIEVTLRPQPVGGGARPGEVGRGAVLLRGLHRRHRGRGRHPRLRHPHPGAGRGARCRQPLRLLEPRGGPAAPRRPHRHDPPRPPPGPPAGRWSG